MKWKFWQSKDSYFEGRYDNLRRHHQETVKSLNQYRDINVNTTVGVAANRELQADNDNMRAILWWIREHDDPLYKGGEAYAQGMHGYREVGLFFIEEAERLNREQRELNRKLENAAKKGLDSAKVYDLPPQQGKDVPTSTKEEHGPNAT